MSTLFLIGVIAVFGLGDFSSVGLQPRRKLFWLVYLARGGGIDCRCICCRSAEDLLRGGGGGCGIANVDAVGIRRVAYSHWGICSLL